MKKSIFFLLIISLLINSNDTYAAESCSPNSVTVVYINGIFVKSEAEAKKDTDLLKDKFKDNGGSTNVTFLTGYNPSHFFGAGDIVKSLGQVYFGGNMDIDLVNILNDLHSKVKTQKILLVGHSQGTWYTNAAYQYLINNGVSRESIAIYNVATPTDNVAGVKNINQKDYLTSNNDQVIKKVKRVGNFWKTLGT
jgi:hypothetical protein